jgi:rhodanese-related sulfurtransferase
METLAEQKLKKTDTIIVYCASYTCHASTQAAKKLLDLGYKQTLDFKGGKRWWQHAGLTFEK